MMNTDIEEATRVAYEDTQTNRNYTPGDWPIPQSPFKTTAALAEAMTKYTSGRAWHVDCDAYLGGVGHCVCIFNEFNEIIHLWRDASGGWYPERKVGANWLVDLDLLDKLIGASKPVKTCKIHADPFSDFEHKCHDCAIDHATLARWEIRVGLRCEVCGKTQRYCEC